MGPFQPRKRRKITPPEDSSEEDSTSPSTLEASPVVTSESELSFSEDEEEAEWDVEQDYEQRPRTLEKKAKKESNRLPIKTSDGIIQAVEDEEVAGSESGDSDSEDGEDAMQVEPAPKPKVSERVKILEAQEELARLATQLNEDPEEHAELFKSLTTIADSDNKIIKKLALVTQLAVYRDVIPGYRIRPLTKEEQNAKVSKDIKQLRRYEQALVNGYQSFVKDLQRLAKSSRGKREDGLDEVAISCACALLVAVPHFNFRGDLLHLIVTKLSVGRPAGDQMFAKCIETLETVFRDDEQGRISKEAIGLLTKMMKSRNYNVDQSVLNTFLHLRLLTEFTHKASQTSVDRKKVIDSARGKRSKKERAKFRTKKQKKGDKVSKQLEKDMNEADAVVSNEERDHLQAETLKMVFVTYFRILKARSPRLMGAVLEGLAKFAHLINQDFFGDLLEALKDLIGHADREAAEAAATGDNPDDDEEEEEATRNTSREALLCVVTAFALMQGQDVSSQITGVSMDMKYFTSYLYASLLPLSMNADIELGKNSLHISDSTTPHDENNKNLSSANNKINFSTTTVLLLRCLNAALLPASGFNSRSLPPKRLSAFTKTTMTTSLHFPEKSTRATLGFLNKLNKLHGRRANMGHLWYTDERKGDGIFLAEHPDPEGCNPGAAIVWEGELLRKHFSPGVREEVKALEKTVKENTQGS